MIVGRVRMILKRERGIVERGYGVFYAFFFSKCRPEVKPEVKPFNFIY